MTSARRTTAAAPHQRPRETFGDAQPTVPAAGTELAATAPSGPLSPRSQGQAMLLALPESTAEIGRRVGATKQMVSAWRLGRKAPSPGMRMSLEVACGIPSAAWGLRPLAPSPGVPVEASATEQLGSLATAATPAPSRAAGELAAADPAAARSLAEIDELLEAIRVTRRDPNLLANERVRAVAEERALLNMRERARHEAAVRAADIEALCVAHPRWVALRSAVLSALAPHPQALASVSAALRRLGALEAP